MRIPTLKFYHNTCQEKTYPDSARLAPRRDIFQEQHINSDELQYSAADTYWINNTSQDVVQGSHCRKALFGPTETPCQNLPKKILLTVH